MVEHHDLKVVPARYELDLDGDRLPGEVARWGWCKVCKATLPVGEWFGVCGRGHVIASKTVRWHPVTKKGNDHQTLAPVCRVGECGKYDDGWLATSKFVAAMSYDHFDAWLPEFAKSAVGIKYHSPKTTWEQRLHVDLASAAHGWAVVFAKQRILEAHAAEQTSPGAALNTEELDWLLGDVTF